MNTNDIEQYKSLKKEYKKRLKDPEKNVLALNAIEEELFSLRQKITNDAQSTSNTEPDPTTE